jgi:hypothetical protein
MFDPIANKRDENAEIEGTKWKFSPGVNVSATVPLNFNKAKVKPNLQRKAQLYNDEIDGNFVKQASINSGPMRKNGGNINNDYIEVDADDNDIANYIAQGYEVEELPQAQYAGQTPFVHPNAGATNVLFQKPAKQIPNSKYNKNTPINYQAKLKPVVADNTRDVTADKALAAVQNAAYMASPEYKAKQKAEKEAQAKFEKKQWANYNKMSLGEKVLDRTNAALNQPLVMASNLLMGEQAYIPGMAEGLGEDNINYDEYLKATGQSRGLSVNDVFNAVNPGNWGGHAGREYGKGNYVQGATELGLGLLGLKGAPMGEEIAKRYADKLINLEQKAFKELPGSPNVNFTSDINWADWNKEIPSNKSLMDEYNTIEETSKANGTWMKNPDGSQFEGTPEQFIQQQSINFKKAYPKGFDKSYRGVTYLNSNPDFSIGTTNFSGDRGIFTGDYDLAKGYSSRGSEETLTPNSLENTGGVYELIHPKGKQIDYNTLLSDWMDIDLNKASSKSNLQDRLTTMKKHLKRVQDVEGIPPEVINSYNKNISLLQNYINNFDTYNSDPEALEKMKNVLGDVTTTDDVAEYIPSTDLNKITLRNIIDGGIGDVTIVNNKPGNYLKSAIGNNGMFDLNNPNVYKSILPFIGVAGAASLHNSQQEKLKLKQGGSIELDLTSDEIQAYKKAGYTIEYMPKH